ncbi:MAG: TIGR01244 family sulfur transferase [Sphingomonadaceae bacterium]
MTEFRKLTDAVSASPQITVDDVARAAELGFVLIVNNRPDDEADDQTPGAEIEAAARAAGLDYVAIPVSNAGFGQGQVTAMADALEGAKGPVLAYCRSGTRSTLLWALAAASQGESANVIAARAADAGYDISPVRQMIDILASGGGS